MKTFLLFIFFSSTAVASSDFLAPLIIGGTAATAVVGTQGAFYRALIQNELKNWSRPETGTSVRLEKQCGVEAEFHLAGNNRKNFLLMGIANSSSDSIVVRSREIKFVYDNKQDRFPGYVRETSDDKISSGWWQVTWIPFPSKDEFKGVDAIRVEVPVWNETTGTSCTITTAFERTGNNKIEEQSYSAVEFIIDGGSGIGQYGNIEELGKPHGIVAIELNFFLRPNHGFGMVFSSESDFDGSNNPKILSEFDGGRGYSAGVTYFGLQYVYRHFFTPDVYLTYGPGTGAQFIEDMKENDRNNRESSTDFAFSEKLMLNWRFHQWNTPSYEVMDFFTGIGVVHYWSPTPEVNGQDLSGNRLSALLRFGMGF